MEPGGGAGVVVDWVLPASTIGGAGIAIFWWAMWLSGKFNEMRKEFASAITDLGDRILDKMEYHEKHDDARFNNIQNDLFSIKLRNAAIDGKKEKGNGTL